MTPPAKPVSSPIVAAVREFVEREVCPVAAGLEHADAYPHELVARMKALGLFGCLVPREYGGLGLDVTTYARVIEELCRGWMSLAGVINSHTMAALIVLHHGTEEQRARFLPRFARGEARGGLCLTEPHAGSDVQAIRTVARRDGDRYLVSGSKMFVTNGREGNTFALLAVTDPAAAPRHRGMSCFIVEKGAPGLQVVKSIGKLGYKGVDTAELLFDNFPVPAANLVGGVEGRGFKHVMSGLETGRINIAARAVGVAQAALEAATEAAARRAEPVPELAEMATRVQGARLLTYWAAGMKDRGERCDLEAGMAKLYASETAQDVALAALRLLGPEGQVAGSPVERLYRDTPLMIIGEGTNEIQRLIICRKLLERYGERLGALTSLEGEPEERRQMVLAVRQLVEKDVVPVVPDYEREGRHPAPLVERLAELGIFGALASPEHGGLGLDLTSYAMVLEEVARGWSTLAGLVAAQGTAAHLLSRFGGPEHRERWLPRLTRGEAWGCPVPSGGIRARRDARGWVLDGAAPLVEVAGRGDFFLVATAGENGRRLCALVERGTRGLAISPPRETLGRRGLEPADLELDGVVVTGSAVLGGSAAEREQAAALLGGLLALGRAATAVGVAQAAFEAALRYSQQRSAFGQPICQHQAIQLKLADMATRTTAARLLTGHAAERLEAGNMLAAAMARIEAAETAYAVALESMRVHGGYGYTSEFSIERYYRDAARLLTAAPEASDGRRQVAGAWVATQRP